MGYADSALVCLFHKNKVQDSSPVKGQQGQFIAFKKLCGSSVSVLIQASHCIMRVFPGGTGSPVVVACRLSSCAVRTCPVTCGMWGLSSPTRNQTCIARQITDYWTIQSPNSCFQRTEFRATSKTQLNESQALTNWIHFCLL